MLTRLAVGTALAILVFASNADAQDEDKDGVRRPERLTVGVADQLLGQLAPDHRTLYFISNRNTTNEVFSQNVDDGKSHILFDDGGEVTWPRVSPDGKRILYISYAHLASGQLCIRDLPKGEDRECTKSVTGAPLLAEWVDKDRIVFIERATIDGNLRVLEMNASGKLEGKTLVERNMTSPAISPDGKWVVYVPLERSSAQVGPAFAAHAARYLEAMRLDDPKTVVKIDPDLPGLTGQPAFSRDGKWLYFVQFFSDSNHDGFVDASDHGVLFRAPVANANGLSISGAADQLTDENWNCQYPAPASDRLLMTCSRGRNLDLYTIPLEGEVPSDWDATRLQTEIDLAGGYSRVQLLNYQRLVHATTPAMKRFMMFRLVRLHLAMEEPGPAEFWAKHIEALGSEDDKAMAEPLLVLIEHRRALRDRERGRIFEDFDAKARARLDKLPVQGNDTSAGAMLRRIVRSEIADTMGDKGAARRELEAVPGLDQANVKHSRSVMEAYYERADALYRELDDREGLVKACTRLANMADLPDDERLTYARAAVRAMVRGVPYDEAAKRLEKEKADGELAFAITLHLELLKIRDEHPGKQVKEEFLALYEKEQRVDRRRAIMLDAVERATRFGADPVIEGLAEHYLDSSAVQEQRRAKRLYTQVMIGRAFRHRAANKLPEARAEFEAVAKRTKSLEAVVGLIDLRLRAGEPAAAIQADFTDATAAHFAKAYLLSRTLVKLRGEAREKAAAAALDALRPSWPELKKECMGQALFGAIAHEQYLETGDLAQAERAGTHYLVALELAGENLRYKAMVLGQLGILHTEVGNYRIALGYLEERVKLPYAENSEGMAVRLAMARSYLHAGNEGEAATKADEALELLNQGAPEFLQKYRPLVLDRAALYNLAANRFERATKLYEEEMALPQPDPKNAFRIRIAHAAAALGAELPAKTIASLDVVDKALADDSHRAIPAWPHADAKDVVRAYRLITAGLRARALQKLGQLDAAARALNDRKALLATEKEKSDHGEYVRLLMLAEAQLADNAVQRKDAKTAEGEIGKALLHSDELHARAQGAIDTDQLDVILFAARTSVDKGEPIAPDLAKRLETAHDELSKVPDAKLRTYRQWLEIYLAMAPAAPSAPAAKAPAP